MYVAVLFTSIRRPCSVAPWGPWGPKGGLGAENKHGFICEKNENSKNHIKPDHTFFVYIYIYNNKAVFTLE